MAAAPGARAGHEVPYYPSFYPQEIRVEPLDPKAAGREFSSKTDPLHAYIGTAPHFGDDAPTHLKTAVSLRSFVILNFNPRSDRLQTPDARCEAAEQTIAALAPQADIVAHRYPITPYHADYLHHGGPAEKTKPAHAVEPVFRLRFSNASAPFLVSTSLFSGGQWDAAIEEIDVGTLLAKANVGFNGWPAPPWAKEGWFQAYHLLRPAVSDAGDRERADEIYDRLIQGGGSAATERVRLERELMADLTRGCDRIVVGYRLRREFYNDDFSNGIENIAFDSQSGFNSPVFLRTVKLKDFPWNGWLRLGMSEPATAAWNPVAGFTDAAGRLAWSAVGDNAFLPIPYNSGWVFNRTEIRPDDEAKPGQSIRIPADALAPEPGTGRLAQVGAGKGAMAKVQYRVSASAFHDGTEMEPADHFYPYALAFRWGGGPADGGVHDPDIAAATRLMRERFRGVRIVRVEETVLPIADLNFHYRWPIVDVYLDDVSTDQQEAALIAPPWSSVPWPVLALMEAAVVRGIAAFSQTEADRRRLPWLDLVRDPAQLARFRALIKEFVETGYRPDALQDLVTAEAAKARWQALDKFVETHGHLLVTNGPYRLRSYSPEVTTFDVIREFTYPIGLGTFDSHAYPPRAGIVGVERAGDRILIAADVEIALKEQRDRRLVRMPLKRDTLRETLPIRPVPRYVIVDATGKVAAAGNARWERDGRFSVPLSALPAGRYSAFTGIFLDGNTIDPAIGRIEFEKN